ncbi:MAG: DUF4143 domain-containing protein [Bacteroidales bacterium]|nr:DUF4143 domain-containing protein [Bacteroidales bacterium]
MGFVLETVSFEEFLRITGEREALELYREVPFPNYGYDRLVDLFHQFCLVGGIPEVVRMYGAKKQIQALAPMYLKHLEILFYKASSLGSTSKTSERLLQIYQDTFPFAGTRIKYSGFSNPGFRSREIGNAFRLFQEQGLLRLLFPTTQAILPWQIDTSRSPRIQLPDTGLVNYFTGIQDALSEQHDLSSVFDRQISLHIVAQELMQSTLTSGQADERTGGQADKQTGEMGDVYFWVRAKTQSSAEVDFVIGHEGLMIPVEVKKGESGRLRSLHQFVDASPHPFAVRLYAGPLMVRETRTITGKIVYLMSLPYFLAGKIREHLEGFIKFVN